MFSLDTLQRLVEVGLPGSKVQVRDTTGTNDHFEVVVVTSAFQGKGSVDRHRMVYATLGTAVAVGGAIHALSLRTLTPEEAERK